MKLTEAQERAFALLASVPQGVEVDCSKQDAIIFLGLGYLVGKHYAVYRGDLHFALTLSGRIEGRRALQGSR